LRDGDLGEAHPGAEGFSVVVDAASRWSLRVPLVIFPGPIPLSFGGGFRGGVPVPCFSGSVRALLFTGALRCSLPVPCLGLSVLVLLFAGGFRCSLPIPLSVLSEAVPKFRF